MANGIDSKVSTARAQIGCDSSDPLRPELNHMPFSAPSASGSSVASGPVVVSRLETEGKPLVGSFNTTSDTYGRPYDGMARLDGAHLRMRSNARATSASFDVKPGHTTTTDGIRQRIEYGASKAARDLSRLLSDPMRYTAHFDYEFPKLEFSGVRPRDLPAELRRLDAAFAYLLEPAIGGTRAALAPVTYDGIHMVDAASAKRAAARLGALADDGAAAQKVLGEGWTITRTSSAKIGMSGSGPIPGGDAPGYESTWAFSIASPSGLRFGVQVGIEERRYAGTPESRGEIRTSTIENGRLFSLAEQLIRYATAK